MNDHEKLSQPPLSMKTLGNPVKNSLAFYVGADDSKLVDDLGERHSVLRG